MPNLSFFPGPSPLYPEVRDLMGRAYDEGILQINHRSDAFMALYAGLKQTLRDSWELPPGYEIVFTSSATECWEIIIQSLLSHQVHFLYNGAFGKKWFKYAVHSPNQSFTLRGSRFLENEGADTIALSSDLRWLCFVQNETSNGTAISMSTLENWRKDLPDTRIAVDATSSLGGSWLDWSLADVWFGSVQKCLGLPAGMAVMILSPKAQEEAFAHRDQRYYNSLPTILENANKNQTHTTPNVLSIYLLAELWKQLPTLRQISAHIDYRSRQLDVFFEEKGLHLIENPAVRSSTVKALVGNPDQIQQWKESASHLGITLGGGYGEWKGKTIRIANFPAIADEAYQTLQTLF